MRRLIRNVIVCVALAVLGTGGLCHGDGHRPVMSPNHTNTEKEISEGVIGRVADAEGRPVAGALIVPRSLDRDGPPVPEIAIASRSDGRYAWRLSPGRYEITASAKGYKDATVRATVNTGQVTIRNFTLARIP